MYNVTRIAIQFPPNNTRYRNKRTANRKYDDEKEG